MFISDSTLDIREISSKMYKKNQGLVNGKIPINLKRATSKQLL